MFDVLGYVVDVSIVLWVMVLGWGGCWVRSCLRVPPPLPSPFSKLMATDEQTRRTMCMKKTTRTRRMKHEEETAADDKEDEANDEDDEDDAGEE